MWDVCDQVSVYYSGNFGKWMLSVVSFLWFDGDSDDENEDDDGIVMYWKSYLVFCL